MGSRRAGVFGIVVVLTLATGAARAEERTINAAAPWEGRARVFVTGVRHGFLLGVFAGRLSVEGGPNPLEGAQVQCPAAVDADYGTNTQRAEGRCIVTTASGDRVFARWSCTGEPDKGCSGRFVLAGGTGSYQGVSGEGDMTIRLVLSNLISFERLEAEYDLAGVVSWSGLTYRTR
jgi:hypothetical protein